MFSEFLPFSWFVSCWVPVTTYWIFEDRVFKPIFELMLWDFLPLQSLRKALWADKIQIPWFLHRIRNKKMRPWLSKQLCWNTVICIKRNAHTLGDFSPCGPVVKQHQNWLMNFLAAVSIWSILMSPCVTDWRGRQRSGKRFVWAAWGWHWAGKGSWELVWNSGWVCCCSEHPLALHQTSSVTEGKNCTFW